MTGMTGSNHPSPVRLLGAIIAGGQSRRFGRDKALATINGGPMIDHVVAALRPQVDALVICGRALPGMVMLPDRPQGQIGPLAGLNAALYYAAANGFVGVLCAPVDVLPLPDDLRARLFHGPNPAVFAEQHSIGYWPASLAGALDAYLAEGNRRIDGWIAVAGAKRIPEPFAMRNINRVEDMP